jgi:hypothetical protein
MDNVWLRRNNEQEFSLAVPLCVDDSDLLVCWLLAGMSWEKYLWKEKKLGEIILGSRRISSSGLLLA